MIHEFYMGDQKNVPCEDWIFTMVFDLLLMINEESIDQVRSELTHDKIAISIKLVALGEDRCPFLLNLMEGAYELYLGSYFPLRFDYTRLKKQKEIDFLKDVLAGVINYPVYERVRWIKNGPSKTNIRIPGSPNPLLRKGIGQTVGIYLPFGKRNKVEKVYNPWSTK